MFTIKCGKNYNDTPRIVQVAIRYSYDWMVGHNHAAMSMQIWTRPVDRDGSTTTSGEDYGWDSVANLRAIAGMLEDDAAKEWTRRGPIQPGNAPTNDGTPRYFSGIDSIRIDSLDGWVWGRMDTQIDTANMIGAIFAKADKIIEKLNLKYKYPNCEISRYLAAFAQMGIGEIEYGRDSRRYYSDTRNFAHHID